MNKEIYLIELSNLTPHLETTFEITIKHLENNDKVNYYFFKAIKSIPDAPLVLQAGNSTDESNFFIRTFVINLID